jgi:hydroxymethylglutaryl-CoA lyase
MTMQANDRRPVEIMEVAPRDGFQSIAVPLPTDEKIAIIEGLIDAGCRRIEIGSFVSPKAIPQMADMKEIAAHFRGRDAARLAALVPNTRGAELALQNGLREVVYVFSASEAHNRNNVRRSVGESIAGLRDVVSIIRGEEGTRLRLDLATSFDCPFTGPVAPDAVQRALGEVFAFTTDLEVALCDTTGRANPVQVRTLFEAVMAERPDQGVGWAFHGHDTFGMGVANVLFAYECGVRVFDGSAAGLGGCPFAPGATGNTATEDIVFALEEAGIPTGIDLKALLGVADRVAALPGACVGGHLRSVPRQRAVLEPAQ